MQPDETEHENIFLKEKPCKILIEVNNPQTDNYPSEIAKATGCTYSHTVRLIQRMEKMDLITSEKEGRRKMLELTDKGRKIAKSLSETIEGLR